MQEELTALQPELIQTSAETDKMMVKIEAETVEVDAKKELVSADEQVANDAAAAAQAIKVWIIQYEPGQNLHKSLAVPIFFFQSFLPAKYLQSYKLHCVAFWLSSRMSVRETWQKRCLHWRPPYQP